ncbi:hypothetical protein RRG08_055614 [Elysia crispata]|uniref:Uncharacterized protein n=1 Tax=Elysia crispata TaxID=231223 RepID=A0AAE0ZGY8_9GAST|nr:hypothetical protein RRG08_055614 [Elysia crispata]
MEDSVHSTKAVSPSYDQLQDVLELCGNEERVSCYLNPKLSNSDQVLPIYHNLPLHCRIVTKFYLSTTIYLFTVE